MDGNKTEIKNAMSILMRRKETAKADDSRAVDLNIRTTKQSTNNLAHLLNGYSRTKEETFDVVSFEDRIAANLASNNKTDPRMLLNGGKFISKSNAQQSMMLTLKVPYLTKNTIDRQLKVTLKVDKLKLQEITKPKPKIKANKSSHPFFKAVASKFETSSSLKAQKEERKELDYQLMQEPTLGRYQFINRSLVGDETQDLHQLYASFGGLTLKHKKKKNIKEVYHSNCDELVDFYCNSGSMNQTNLPIYDSQPMVEDLKTLKKAKYHNLKDPRFKRIDEIKISNSALWCDAYKPLKSTQLLQTLAITKELHQWIKESLIKLRKVDKQKRIELLKNKKRKPFNPLDDFIVLDEYLADDSEDIELNFVPSLIIEGPTGCGKTSAVHAIITENHGGHVFELNSSQSRAKKDIEFHLKQIGTTSMVGNDENTVILFDDVELIDENDTDKDFWSGVLELLSYSYRPIIFTTNDISKIPKNIVKESTVYKFFNPIHRNHMEYLDLIAMDQKLFLDSSILRRLCKFDLRKSIMELQMLSNYFDLRNGPLKITYSTNLNKPPSAASCCSIEQHLLKLELAYSSDLSSRPISHRRFDNNLRKCIKFYSSKLNNNRARHKADPTSYDEFIEKNSNSLFIKLSRSELAMNVLPFIKSMARNEHHRLKKRREFDSAYINNHADYLTSKLPIVPECKFALDPEDIFEDI